MGNIVQVPGGPPLSSISLSSSVKKKFHPRFQPYKGSNCEWIDLNKVLQDGDGCANGHKFVIKSHEGFMRILWGCKSFLFCSGIRKQLLFVEGKTILAFVTRGSKFTNCPSFTEVTTLVDCKVEIFGSFNPHFTPTPWSGFA